VVDYMEQVALMKFPVPGWDVERLNRAITLYTSLGKERALAAMRSSRTADFKSISVSPHRISCWPQFTPEETTVFEEELDKNGGLDAIETAKVLGKRPAEVLRYSYIWKNKKLKVENEALRHHHKVSTGHARQNKTLGAPSLGRIRTKAESVADSADDEVSLYGAEFGPGKKAQCAACSTRISRVWWRAPRSIPGNAMCENCG
jgi:hypothetical protein